MPEALTAGFTFWWKCIVFAAQHILELVWDPRAVALGILAWAALVIKNWNELGWKSAGWMLLERAALAIKALKWPAKALVLIFLFILLFVAPAERYRELRENHDELTKVSESYHDVIMQQDIEIDTLNTDIGEARRDKGELLAQIHQLKNNVRTLEARLDDRAAVTAEKAKRAIIREQLGRFLKEAGGIWRRCARREYGGECDSKEWANQVKAFLASHFDSSYTTRFENPRLQKAFSYAGSRIHGAKIELFDNLKELFGKKKSG